MDYSVGQGGDFEHLRPMPIEKFLAEAASYLFQRSVNKLGGTPVETVNFPEIRDGKHGLSESVSVDYEGRTGDIVLTYSWSAKEGKGHTSYGNTQAKRLKFDGTEVEWATQYNDGSQKRASREVIIPSDLHEDYFRDVVIRALVHRKKSLDSIVNINHRNIETIESPFL